MAQTTIVHVVFHFSRRLCGPQTLIFTYRSSCYDWYFGAKLLQLRSALRWGQCEALVAAPQGIRFHKPFCLTTLPSVQKSIPAEGGSSRKSSPWLAMSGCQCSVGFAGRSHLLCNSFGVACSTWVTNRELSLYSPTAIGISVGDAGTEDGSLTFPSLVHVYNGYNTTANGRS